VPGCANWATCHRLANEFIPSHTYSRS
jgi:hypothetical protein